MRIYFIGIGGIGISALAQYYLEKGHEIFGSDIAGSEIIRALRKKGAKIISSIPQKCDLVVYSSAVPKTNADLKKAKKLKIKCLSYPEALGKLTEKYFTIAVSGTHGKTTTTAMLALILIRAGVDPTVIIGTKLKEFNDANFRIGKSKYLLIEADEHFASFLNYWPQIIVITNIEADHLDFYKNLKNIKTAFKKFIGHLPEGGILINNTSINKGDFLKIKKILRVPGEHNIYDASLALAAARALKVPDNISFEALSEYRGAWRRFEIIKTKPFILISDYGHNPQKALAALKGAREKYSNKKIWCVYQPHQYERTHYLFNEFIKAFKKAPVDNLIITDIFDVAGRESKQIRKKVNSQKLVRAINKNSVKYLPKDSIVDYLREEVKSGEVVIVMGAGDIYKIVDSL